MESTPDSDDESEQPKNAISEIGGTKQSSKQTPV